LNDSPRPPPLLRAAARTALCRTAAHAAAPMRPSPTGTPMQTETIMIWRRASSAALLPPPPGALTACGACTHASCAAGVLAAARPAVVSALRTYWRSESQRMTDSRRPTATSEAVKPTAACTDSVTSGGEMMVIDRRG
jgi:hypothetical protein